MPGKVVCVCVCVCVCVVSEGLGSERISAIGQCLV
jgi:hypothetical protein